MMPLAFDLISTLVTGSIFPVATTDRVIGPRSTAARRDGSMALDAPRTVERYAPAATSATTAAARAMVRDLVMGRLAHAPPVVTRRRRDGFRAPPRPLVESPGRCGSSNPALTPLNR